MIHSGKIWFDFPGGVGCTPGEFFCPSIRNDSGCDTAGAENFTRCGCFRTDLFAQLITLNQEAQISRHVERHWPLFDEP